MTRDTGGSPTAARAGHELDVVDLTRCLVETDSQNPGVGERAVAELIAEEIAAPRGFRTTWLEFVPGRPNLVVTVDRGPGPHLGLAGHLDTKPVGDTRAAWATDPLRFTVADGTAYGLGTSDMKGAVAAMLVALERYAASGPAGRVSLVLTADEEAASAAGAIPLAHGGHLDCDALVIGEPSGVDAPWESLAVVSRGICCVEIDIRTRQGHSGLAARLGRNANLLAAELLLAFERYRPTVSTPGPVRCEPTVNAGMLLAGGVGFGTWPGHCRVGCEIRLVPGMDRDVVRGEIAQLVAGVVQPPAQFTISYPDSAIGWGPAASVDPGHPVVAAARAAGRRVLGRELPLGAYPGTTEAAHYLGAGIPTIASLGPGWLSVAHGANEHVGIDQLHQATDLYTEAIREYLGGTSSCSGR